MVNSAHNKSERKKIINNLKLYRRCMVNRVACICDRAKAMFFWFIHSLPFFGRISFAHSFLIVKFNGARERTTTTTKKKKNERTYMQITDKWATHRAAFEYTCKHTAPKRLVKWLPETRTRRRYDRRGRNIDQKKSYSKWKTNEYRKKKKSIPRFLLCTKKPRDHSSVSQSTAISSCGNICNFLLLKSHHLYSQRSQFERINVIIALQKI